MTVLFPSREIERVRLVFDRLLAALFQLRINLLDLVLLHVIADFVVTVAGVYHAEVVENATVLHSSVRRLDKAVVVDPRIAAQRRDQTDVRTFRGLNRADASVVRGVHVADFKSRALTRQAARAKRR